MDRLRYLLVLAACLAVTLPLEAVLGARVYRRPRRLLAALAPVLAVFVLWDLVATARGHWWFSPRYTTGATLLGLPVEEWLFFLVVPLCALLTFEVLGRGPAVRRRLSRRDPAHLADHSTQAAPTGAATPTARTGGGHG
ncbi:lycopene cyclase domain-containing protein [Catellatospora sp. NPDC049609]|uniref:lycopene cyclase domain-containing protein n=1 Tax=Catellatospora sp. NPDC049609 TaxID=3155505 RepID=UPI003432668C